MWEEDGLNEALRNVIELFNQNFMRMDGPKFHKKRGRRTEENIKRIKFIANQFLSDCYKKKPYLSTTQTVFYPKLKKKIA